MRHILLILTLLFSTNANAELYQGITPYSTLGEIKKRFPNAQITPVKAAWVRETDGFYLMEGQGLPGKAYMAFNDARPTFKILVEVAQQIVQEVESSPPSAHREKKLENARKNVERYADRVNDPDEAALTISWVRWVPSEPIPVARYIAKFGKPTKTDFSDDTMQPYSLWANRGLTAKLSDDQKFVLNVEYEFTAKEKAAECRARYPNRTNC